MQEKKRKICSQSSRIQTIQNGRGSNGTDKEHMVQTRMKKIMCELLTFFSGKPPIIFANTVITNTRSQGFLHVSLHIKIWTFQVVARKKYRQYPGISKVQRKTMFESTHSISTFRSIWPSQGNFGTYEEILPVCRKTTVQGKRCQKSGKLQLLIKKQIGVCQSNKQFTMNLVCQCRWRAWQLLWQYTKHYGDCHNHHALIMILLLYGSS